MNNGQGRDSGVRRKCAAGCFESLESRLLLSADFYWGNSELPAEIFVEQGQEFTIPVRLLADHDGTEDASFRWSLYRSDDPAVSEYDFESLYSDPWLGSTGLSGATWYDSTLTAWFPVGTYYLAFRADSLDQVAETDETNNWSNVIVLNVTPPAVAEAVTGIVYDRDTEMPLENVWVELHQQVWGYGSYPIASGSTDSTGKYSLEYVPDGQYQLVVWTGHSDGSKTYMGAWADVTVVGGQADIDLELREAGLVYGYVRDELGYGIYDVLVKIDAEYGHPLEETLLAWTDTDGRYEIYVPATSIEMYQVEVVAGSWLSGNYASTSSGSVLYSASTAGTAGPDFVLQQAAGVRGRLIATDGKIIADAEVSFDIVTFGPGNLHSDVGIMVTTDSHGNFELPGIPVGQKVWLELWIPTENSWDTPWGMYSAGCRWIEVPTGLEAGQWASIGDVQVLPAGVVVGQITDELGNPIAGALVEAVGTDKLGGEIDEDEFSTWTDASGFYVLPAVPEGTVRLNIQTDGYLPVVLGPMGINHLSPQVRNVVLAEASQGALLSGTVVNHDDIGPRNDSGMLLPRLRVDCDEMGVVDEVGVFTYAPSQLGSLQSHLRMYHGFLASQEVFDGYDDWMTYVGSGGSFELTVPAGPQILNAYRSKPGPEGTWCVNLSEPMMLDPSAGAELSGLSLSVELGTSSVVGKVQLPAKHPGIITCESVAVVLKDSGTGNMVAFGEVGPQGHYFLSDLPSGSYQLFAVADGIESPLMTVALSEGAEVVQDLALGTTQQADLAVSIDAEPLQLRAGQTAAVKVYISNAGAQPLSGADVVLYLRPVGSSDPVEIARTSVSLQAGKSVDWSAGFIAPAAVGDYELYAVADPQGWIAESNEANNVSDPLAVQVQVSGGEVVGPILATDIFPLNDGCSQSYTMTIDGRRGNITRRTCATETAGLFEMRRFCGRKLDGGTFYSLGGDGEILITGQTFIDAGRAGSVEFSPALEFLPGLLAEGGHYESTSNWTVIDGQGIEWTGTYSQSLDVIGYEQVLTPLGVKNCLKVQLVVDNTRSADGQDDIEGHDETTLWLAGGLGIVRQSGTWAERQGGGDWTTWTFDQLLTTPQATGLGDMQDLAVNPGKVNLPNVLAAGQQVRVPVLVGNMGNVAFAGQVNVQLFASADGVLDTGDRALGGSSVALRLSPGRAGTAWVTLTVPDDLPAGNYTFFVGLDSGALAEADFANNVAMVGSSAVVCQVGNLVEGPRINAISMRDALGQTVTLSLRGAGQASVTRDEGGNLLITVTGTDSRSQLLIIAPRGAQGAIAGITVDGDIGAIVGPAIDLSGSIIVGGSVGKIVLDDLTGADITIAGSGRAAAMQFDQLSGGKIVSASPIASLIASEWLAQDGTNGSLAAPAVGKLTTAGDARRGIAGDLQADVTVGSAYAYTPDPTQAVALLKVSGSISDSVLDIAGSLARLIVGRQLLSSTVRTGGDIGSIALGQAIDSDFLAGTWLSSGHATSDYDFARDSRIGAVSVLGIAGQPGPSFVNSSFSASRFGTVRLADPELYNEGQEFGFFARWGGLPTSLSIFDSLSRSWEKWPGSGVYTGGDLRVVAMEDMYGV